MEKQKRSQRKVFIREWIADLCGLHPLEVAELFRKEGYSPVVVRRWILDTVKKEPNRIWDRERGPTRQEKMSETTKASQVWNDKTPKPPLPPKRRVWDQYREPDGDEFGDS